jgi:hypothetical protein
MRSSAPSAVRDLKARRASLNSSCSQNQIVQIHMDGDALVDANRDRFHQRKVLKNNLISN